MPILLTDQCFLAVLVVGMLMILLSLRTKLNRLAYLQIFTNPLSCSAAIVLFFFVLIGILDCLYIMPAPAKTTEAQAPTQQISLLDSILAPLGSTYENTYSAPLALNSYAKENTVVNGQARQQYPRLKYPSSSINTKEKKALYIYKALLQAGCYGLVITLFVGLLNFLIRRYAFSHSSWPIKKIWPLLTLFACLFIIFFCYQLSREFHVLGTGKIGQDIFYHSVKSIRTGLIIGILTTLFMLPLALFLGITAGYFGGIVDDIIQFIYTTLSSIPGILLITASVLSMQTYIANHPNQFITLSQSADARLFALCLILGMTSWTSLCRLLRAEALKLREVDYVMAARALGSSSFTIFRKHLLPNMLPIILITLVLDFSFLVLAEAVLSYVGVGVSPLTISWGNMINGARLELAREPIVWWPIIAAFSFMFILVLASNIFADAVREAFDPHHTH